MERRTVADYLASILHAEKKYGDCNHISKASCYDWLYDYCNNLNNHILVDGIKCFDR